MNNNYDYILLSPIGFKFAKTLLGLTYHEIAVKTNISVSSLLRWSNGISQPTTNHRKIFFEFLQKSKIDLSKITIAIIINTILSNFDNSTYTHCLRVAEICRIICSKVKNHKINKKVLIRAAIFHDIGKLLVPLTILNKHGKLNDDEYQKIKTHTNGTCLLLKKLYDLNDITIMTATSHHERIDGQGYPKKLYGKDISEEIKILSVADVFEALTAQRPYKKALTVEIALKIMSKDAGLEQKYVNILKDLAKKDFFDKTKKKYKALFEI